MKTQLRALVARFPKSFRLASAYAGAGMKRLRCTRFAAEERTSQHWCKKQKFTAIIHWNLSELLGIG
jgi:hypothetical protein